MTGISRAVADHVMTLRFDRAEKKNAITDAMYDRLREALDAAAGDDAVRVVFIGSTSGNFTSGRDIGEFAATNAAALAGRGPADIFGTSAARLIRRLADFPKPLVASVRGLAVGFGTTMLLHCDLVFVERNARLSAPFVGLGLSPEAGSTLLMPRLAGYQHAFAMFALGASMSGEEAAQIGLAYQATDPGESDGAALAAALRLAALPPRSLQATKRLMRDAVALEPVLAAETRTFAERLASAEAAEAFSAFREKRKPDFRNPA